MNTTTAKQPQAAILARTQVGNERPTRRAAVAGLMTLPLAAFAADSPTAADAELLSARERVWRDWFAGDRKALLAILPADFLGFSLGGGPGRTRMETIADAEGFAAGGGTLTDLAYSNNRIQKIGNVAVLYCNFTFTTKDKAGVASTTTGRVTEIFVREGTRWIHPGWHLEATR